MPNFKNLPDISYESDESEIETYDDQKDVDFEGPPSSKSGFSQQELNVLIRDLGLTKKSSELLASRSVCYQIQKLQCISKEKRIFLFFSLKRTNLSFVTMLEDCC